MQRAGPLHGRNEGGNHHYIHTGRHQFRRISFLPPPTLLRTQKALDPLIKSYVCPPGGSSAALFSPAAKVQSSCVLAVCLPCTCPPVLLVQSTPLWDSASRDTCDKSEGWSVSDMSLPLQSYVFKALCASRSFMQNLCRCISLRVTLTVK